MGPTSSDGQIKRHLLRLARWRAKKSGLPFALTEDDLFIPTKCPVLGRGFFSAPGMSPSLDRVRPALGYVPGNVIVVSVIANTIRSNARPADILRVAHFYAQIGDP